MCRYRAESARRGEGHKRGGEGGEAPKRDAKDAHRKAAGGGD